ncbi:MAG: aspartate ammonia-lyase [Desulfobacca sp.]
MAERARTTAWRQEKDSLGPVFVPAWAYWGAQTERAVENFPISGLKPHPILVDALVLIKMAAAAANMALGGLPPEKARLIIQAGEEILSGLWREHFVVDVFQAGAGTSLHMNVNEVLANRAAELAARPRGLYDFIHPNDHVNLGQSTNDVFPTAMRLAILMELRTFYPEGEALVAALEDKSREFADIYKAGRTHLNDALPLTLGDEFAAYAAAVAGDLARLRQGAEDLAALGIGGTAVGTGTNALPGYREAVIAHLRRRTGLEVRPHANLFEAMQNLNPFGQVAADLKLLALTLTRVANDLRLLASGPKTGLAEIILPAVQPGSSIMSGKINPSICEALNMVCFHVCGRETAVALAVQAGQLELNVMMPLVIHELLSMIDLLRQGLAMFTRRAVRGLKADVARCRFFLEQSHGLAALLNPYLGYHRAAELAQESLATGIPLVELMRAKKLLTDQQIDAIFSLPATSWDEESGNRKEPEAS